MGEGGWPLRGGANRDLPVKPVPAQLGLQGKRRKGRPEGEERAGVHAGARTTVRAQTGTTTTAPPPSHLLRIMAAVQTRRSMHRLASHASSSAQQEACTGQDARGVAANAGAFMEAHVARRPLAPGAGKQGRIPGINRHPPRREWHGGDAELHAGPGTECLSCRPSLRPSPCAASTEDGQGPRPPGGPRPHTRDRGHGARRKEDRPATRAGTQGMPCMLCSVRS